MIAPYAVVCRRDEEYATIFNAQKNGEAADNGLLFSSLILRKRRRGMVFVFQHHCGYLLGCLFTLISALAVVAF